MERSRVASGDIVCGVRTAGVGNPRPVLPLRLDKLGVLHAYLRRGDAGIGGRDTEPQLGSKLLDFVYGKQGSC